MSLIPRIAATEALSSQALQALQEAKESEYQSVRILRTPNHLAGNVVFLIEQDQAKFEKSATAICKKVRAHFQLLGFVDHTHNGAVNPDLNRLIAIYNRLLPETFEGYSSLWEYRAETPSYQALPVDAQLVYFLSLFDLKRNETHLTLLEKIKSVYSTHTLFRDWCQNESLSIDSLETAEDLGNLMHHFRKALYGDHPREIVLLNYFDKLTQDCVEGRRLDMWSRLFSGALTFEFVPISIFALTQIEALEINGLTELLAKAICEGGIIWPAFLLLRSTNLLSGILGYEFLLITIYTLGRFEGYGRDLWVAGLVSAVSLGGPILPTWLLLRSTNTKNHIQHQYADGSRQELTLTESSMSKLIAQNIVSGMEARPKGPSFLISMRIEWSEAVVQELIRSHQYSEIDLEV